MPSFSHFEMSHLILIHTACHAGCSHCPYGIKKESQPIAVELILKEIEATSNRLILLSGGEPLEYPYFSLLLDGLETIYKPFRIATGGHISVLPYLEQLKKMPHFTGFALGTDILIPQRQLQGLFRMQWLYNLTTLNERSMRYSFTITLGVDMHLQTLLEELVELKSQPRFILLAEKEGEKIEEEVWKFYEKMVTDYFPNKPILSGFKNI